MSLAFYWCMTSAYFFHISSFIALFLRLNKNATPLAACMDHIVHGIKTSQGEGAGSAMPQLGIIKHQRWQLSQQVRVVQITWSL